MYLFGIALLVVLSGVSAWCVFGRAFHDCLVERIGLAILCVASMGCIGALWHEQYISNTDLTLIFGLTVFIVGTVIRRVKPFQRKGLPLYGCS